MLQQLNPTTALSTPGFKLVTVTADDLTESVLKEFRAIDGSVTERELDPARVKYLNDMVVSGLAVSFRWATANLNGTTIRINGQHSSTMLEQLLATVGLPPHLKVIREHFEVKDLDSVALLFQQYDTRHSTRDQSDIAGVYQAIQGDELKDVPRTIGKLGIEAYAWFKRTVEGALHVPIGDAQYTLFADKGLHPYLKWLAQLHSVKTKELRNKAVVAACYGTFEANQPAAEDFWEKVSRGGDPDEDDLPETVLDGWLVQMSDPKKKPDGFGVKNFYQGCIYAWNASRAGKRISTVRHDFKKTYTTINE